MTEDEYQADRVVKSVKALEWLGVIALLVLLPLGFCAAEYTPPEAKLRDWGTGRWTAENTMLQAAVIGLDAVAAEQTVDCMKLPACYEVGTVASALYGSRPSANEVWKFFLMKTLGKMFFAYQLDSPVREAGQWVFIGVGALDVRHNQREDLKPDWRLLWGSLGMGLTVHWTFF